SDNRTARPSDMNAAKAIRGLALLLPFADIQTRIGAASRGIRRIVDRTRVYWVELTLRHLSARRRNRRQNRCFPSVNWRRASSSLARGANPFNESAPSPASATEQF